MEFYQHVLKIILPLKKTSSSSKPELSRFIQVVVADGLDEPLQMEFDKQGYVYWIERTWEWVADFYNNKTFPDPVAPISGEVHVLRGGSFISDVANATYFFHAG